MSDQNLSIRIDAKAAGDIAKPFKELGAEAKASAVDLKGLGKEVGGIKKSLDQVQFGILGLSTSIGVLPDTIGKAVVSLNALGSATKVLKGLGGVAGATGLGAGPLAAIAAGIVAIGAAAVAVSPRLQDTFGNAINHITGSAQEAAAALRNLRDAQEDIAFARGQGVGTLGEEARARQRIGLENPFRERARGLEEERARAGDRATALGRFPDQAFNPTQQALAGLAGGDFGGNLAKLQGLAGSPFSAPANLQRDLFMEQGAMGRAGAETGGLRSKLDDFYDRQRIGKRLAEIDIGPRQEIGRLQGELRSQTDQSFGNWSHIAGQKIDWGNWNTLFGQQLPWGDTRGENRSEDFLRGKIGSLQGQLKANSPEAARLRAQLGGRQLAVSGAEGEDINAKLMASSDRLRAQEEKVLEIKQKINLAEVDHLKSIQASVAEQTKLADQAIKEEEAKLRGTKIGLGLSNPLDLQGALAISRKIAGGQDLSRDEMDFAKKHDVFRDSVNAIGLKNAEGNPIIQEILKNVGAEQRLQETQQAKEALVKLDANLKNEIQVKLDLNGADVSQQVRDKVVPEITRAIQEGFKSMEFTVSSRLVQEVQDKMFRQRANIQAANGG